MAVAGKVILFLCKQYWKQKIQQRIEDEIERRCWERYGKKLDDTTVEEKQVLLFEEIEYGVNIICFPIRKIGALVYYLIAATSKWFERYPFFGRFFGFTVGTLLSLMWFRMMVFRKNYELNSALIVSILFGSFLSLGLAFSTKVRCVVSLVAPKMVTGRGRGFLLGYAFLLVMTNPFMNFKSNLHVTANTVICTQELAARMAKQLAKAAGAPFVAIIDKVEQIIDNLVAIAKNLELAFDKVRALFQGVKDMLGSVFSWLTSMFDVCNEKMLMPYRKCSAAFANAEQKCKQKMGILKFFCKIVNLIGKVCHIFRIVELLCLITTAISNAIKRLVGNRVSIVIQKVKDMFWFQVDLEYTYNVTLYQSKSFNEIRVGIAEAMEAKLTPIIIFFRIFDIVTLLLLFLTFFRAYSYVNSFLKRDSFDNRYITQELKDISEKRKELEKSTLLPLSAQDTKIYVDPFTCWLILPERLKLKRSMKMYLIGISIGVFFTIADICLWWILHMINSVGGVIISEEVPSVLKLHVQGYGVLADIYRSMVTQFDPLDRAEYAMDTQECLPFPTEPNWTVTIVIATIYTVCLFCVLFESFLLRLRHVIASGYYPKRAKLRAVYISGKILRRRFEAKQFFKEGIKNMLAGKSDDVEQTCCSRLQAKYPWFGKCCKPCGYNYVTCFSCGASRIKSVDNKMFKCQSLQCKAIYCDDCYPDLFNLCSLCMNPIDYRKFGHVSEERDSSDEDVRKLQKKKKKTKK